MPGDDRESTPGDGAVEPGQVRDTGDVPAALNSLLARAGAPFPASPALSFHPSRTIRLCGASLAGLFAVLESGRDREVLTLPPPFQDPSGQPDQPDQQDQDEETAAFQDALEAARFTDGAYAHDLARLSSFPADCSIEDGLATAERHLRDRVRKATGLSPRLPKPRVKRSEIARSLGVEPTYRLAPSPSAPADDRLANELADKPANDPDGGDSDSARLHGQEADRLQATPLQSLLFEEELDRRFADLHDATESARDDQGAHVLHAAYGLVTVPADAAGSETLVVPAVLQPLTLSAKIVPGRFRWRIKGAGLGARLNLDLVRLLREAGLSLPDMPGADETPVQLLARIRTAIDGKRGWDLQTGAMICAVSDGGEALAADLRALTDETDVAAHPVAARLLGLPAGDVQQPELDAGSSREKGALLITSTEQAGEEAVACSLTGQSVVVDTPAGTDKAGVIANLTAAHLAEGRRVLVVSELARTRHRLIADLEDAGLEAFALDLEDGLTTPVDLLKAVHRRQGLFGEVEPVLPDQTAQARTRHRETLERYDALLGKPFGAIGLTIRDILWTYTKLRLDGVQGRSSGAAPAGQSDDPRPARLPDACDITRDMLDQRSARLRVLDTERAHLATLALNPSSHPWRGLANPLTPPDEQTLVRITEAWRGALDALAATARPIADQFASQPMGLMTGQPGEAGTDSLEGALPLDLARITRLKDVLASLPEPPGASATSAGGPLKHGHASASPASRGNRAEEDMAACLKMLRTPTARKDARRLDDIWTEVARHEEAIAAGFGRAPSDTRSLTDRVGEIAALADACRSAGPDLETLEAVRGETMRLEVARTTLQGLRQSLTAIAEDLGIERIETRTDVNGVIRMGRLLADTPKSAMALRRKDLAGEEAGEALQAVKDGFMDFVRRKQHLDRRIRVNVRIDPRIPRQAAHTLRNTPFLLRPFSAKYRKAVNWARRMVRNHRYLKSAPRFFDGLATLTEDIQWFADHAKLKAFWGPSFKGIDTDIPALEAACAFSREVEDLRARNGAGPAMADFLLNAPATVLESFADRLEGPAGERLRDGARLLEADPDGTGTLSSLISTVDAKLATLKRVETHATAVGLNPKTALKNIESVADGLRRREELLEEVAQISGHGNLTERGFAPDAPTFRAEILSLMGLFEIDLTPAGIEPDLWQTHFLSGDPLATLVKARADGAALNEKLQALDSLSNQIEELTGLAPEQQAESTAVHALKDWARAASRKAGLTAFNAWLRARRDCESENLETFLDHCETEGSGQDLPALYAYSLWHSLTGRIMEAYPDLTRMTGLATAEAVDGLQAAERDILALNRRIIRSRLLSRDNQDTVLPEVLREGSTGDTLGLAGLIREAGDRLQDLKPCWIASPAALARAVPASGHRFDLVIIDSAHAMALDHGLTAVLRGSQAVILGDSRQGMGMDTTDGLGIGSSLMVRALEVFPERLRLTWQVEARHEGLAAHANAVLYDNTLNILPSPVGGDPRLGVKLNGTGGTVRRTSGGMDGAVNSAEARAIVTRALAFMRREPRRSLAIATIHQAQADLIRRMLVRDIRHDPLAADFINGRAGGPEAFAVKTLPMAASASRDVVLISPVQDGSGHDLAAEPLASLTCGAREAIEVFGPPAPSPADALETPHEDDQSTEDSAKPSGSPLMDLAAWANPGHGPEDIEPQDAAGSVIAGALRRHGFEVSARIGTGPHRLPLAVRHPDDPDAFLAAIALDDMPLIDGLDAPAQPAGSFTPTQRWVHYPALLDRARWKVYRIWPVDWFTDADREAEKLLAWLNTQMGRPPGTTVSRALKRVDLTLVDGGRDRTTTLGSGS